MQKFCMKCGAKLLEGSAHCMQCGAKIVGEIAQSPPPQETQNVSSQTSTPTSEYSTSKEIQNQPQQSPPSQDFGTYQSQQVQTQGYQSDQTKRNIFKSKFFLIGLIVIIAIVLILIFFLFLYNGAGGDFIGSWNVEENTAYGYLQSNNVWSFYENGTMKMEIDQYTPTGHETGLYWFDYSLENGRIKSSNYNSPFATTSGVKYEISNGGNTIKIYDTWDESSVKYTLTRK